MGSKMRRVRLVRGEWEAHCVMGEVSEEKGRRLESVSESENGMVV